MAREAELPLVGGKALRGCEVKLVEWLRAHTMPFGRLTATVTVDYQDSVPVMIKVASLVEVEEKFR